MVTFVLVTTALLLTMNVADVEPCGIVMVDKDKVVDEVSLVVSVIWAPPAGAVPLRFTVPVDELPPTIVEGFMVTEAIVTPDTGK